MRNNYTNVPLEVKKKRKKTADVKQLKTTALKSKEAMNYLFMNSFSK